MHDMTREDLYDDLPAHVNVIIDLNISMDKNSERLQTISLTTENKKPHKL